MSLQLVLSWHLTPVLSSSELSWLLVCSLGLLGQGLGYGWRTSWWPRLLLLVSLGVPLLAAAIRALQQPMLPALCLSGLLALSASMGLSHLVCRYWQQRGSASVKQFYRLELIGALAAVVTALLLGPLLSTMTFPWIGFAAFCGLPASRLERVLLGVMTVATLTFPQACRRCASLAYGESKILAQIISPYQYVEVVESHSQRFFFLNSLCHYGTPDMSLLNTYLADLPTEFLTDTARDSGCLILGAGTFMAPALVAQKNIKTTVIELDPAVVQVGMEFFKDIRPNASFKIITGDARSLLSQQAPVGLLVVNVPAAYTLNVASFFTEEFFQKMRQRLVPGGICTVFLGGPIGEDELDQVQGPIVAALVSSFPELTAISSRNCDNTVVFASNESWGGSAKLHQHLRRRGLNRFTLYSQRELKLMSQKFSPASLNNLRFCAAMNMVFW